jgi:septal ring factor EnvC (AmiA/AmiB activator)
MAMSKQLQDRIRRTKAEVKKAKLEIRKLKVELKKGKQHHKQLASGIANVTKNLNVLHNIPFREGPSRRR